MKTGKTNTEILNNDAPRVEYHDNAENHHVLRIKNLAEGDSAEYTFRFHNDDAGWKYSDFPGVSLIVTGLEVVVTPSAVVTEDKRVTLTCSTSCPLTDNTYIWYHNGRPLTPAEGQHKQLVLDPVSAQHAGKYSCAVRTHQNIKSPEETLTVRGKSQVHAVNAVRLMLVALCPVVVSLLYLWIRKKKSLTSTTEPKNPTQAGQTDSEYESISMNAVIAAQRESVEQQEDSV
uniref:Ig-like domain-containing protein n=1 Tax=Myripristis murdjan TaxID=586833 RepID=A0A667X9N5_9TELE